MFNSIGVDLDLDSSFIHPIPKAQTVWQGTSHLKRALNGTPSLPKPSEPHVKELDVLMRYVSAGRTWAPYWYIQLMHVALFWWCDWPSRDGLPHFVLLSVPYVAHATKHPEYAVAAIKNSYTTLLPYIKYWNYLGSVMHLQTYYKKPWRNHGTLYLHTILHCTQHTYATTYDQHGFPMYKKGWEQKTKMAINSGWSTKPWTQTLGKERGRDLYGRTWPAHNPPN